VVQAGNFVTVTKLPDPAPGEPGNPTNGPPVAGPSALGGVVRWCLGERLEIVDTDNAQYQRELRDERDLLESAIAKVDGGPDTGLAGAEGTVAR
jgi:hypothetical protein